MNTIVYKDIALEADTGDDPREIAGLITSSKPDRHGDIVDPSGADTAAYELNPVVLLGHDASKPVARVATLEKRSDGIYAQIKFPEKGISALADETLSLIRSGVLSAFSIGFRILAGGAQPRDAQHPHRGMLIKSWELLEASIVSVPANSGALIMEKHMSAQPETKTLQAVAPTLLKQVNREYSFTRALQYASGDTNGDFGLEKEYAKELQLRAPHREWKGFPIPLNAVLKSTHETVNQSDPFAENTGSSLTGRSTRLDLFERVGNALRDATVMGGLGVQFIDCNEEQLVIPMMTDKVNASWIARDTAAPDGGQGKFKSIELKPKTLALSFDIERSALKYASHPDIEALLLDDARQAIADGLDSALLNGTGVGPIPKGLLVHTEIPTLTGFTAPTEGAFRNAANEVERHMPQGRQAKWVITPASEARLAETPRWTGSQHSFVDTLAGVADLGGREYKTSFKLPPKKAMLGDFSQLIACAFGGALDLAVNPWSSDHFKRGAVLVVGLIDFNAVLRDAQKLRIVTDMAEYAVATP